MKKNHLWIGALVLLLGTTAYAQDLSIYIGNQPIKMDVTPQVKQDTLYVPISFISKQLGAQVKWQNPTLTITKDDSEMICTIGSKAASINGRQIQLSHAPYLSNNRVFVPLRSVSKLLDCNLDYHKQTHRIDISPNDSQESGVLTTPPKVMLMNFHSNFITLPRKWNNKVFDPISAYQAVWKNNEATTNIYRPRVNEILQLDFGKLTPDQVSLKMAYLTNNLQQSDFPIESVPIVKNGAYYEFTHQPIPEPSLAFGSRLYIIEAIWGENVCEYVFVVDNKWNLNAYEKLESRMKQSHALDYRVVGNWVYYVTLGDKSGFHKMLLDGTQDTLICDFSKVSHVNGSTSITSEAKDGYILYKFQNLQQSDASGKLEAPHPIDYYQLNLSHDTLEKVLVP